MRYLKYITKILNSNRKKKGGCVHCGSSMENNKINCKICATLQVDGREITFNGDER